MNKKKLLVTMIFFITFLTTGCWNYIGLNEMTVVSGVAIDKYDNNYTLSFEIYNLQKTAVGEPIKSEIIESTGETIFEAVRNAKKRTSNKLYFAQAKIIIVSEQIAKEEGINSVIDWFTRDPEIRETLQLVVSQEKSAVELLKADKLTSTTVSTDIQNIVEKDQKITSSSENKQLYKIFNILSSDGISLTLPAVHMIENDDKKVCELNGDAIFKADRLVNYLTSEETKYYILAKDKLKGGIITINTKIKDSDTDLQNISLEIKSSASSQKYISQEKNNIKIKISTTTEVTLGEFKELNQKLTNKDLVKLEKEAAKIVKERIENVISKIQIDYDTDIMGFGRLLYRNNPKEWEKLKNTFDEEFKNIEVIVESKIKILNTGFTK
jgi:spore germination protein KC